MNIFRLLGDLSHIASILILIHKITTSRSARGISFKTQALYATVFVARYLALFSPPVFYLVVMKIFFLASSFYVIYLMKFKFRYVRLDLCSSRVEVDIDTIRLEYLLGGSALLALLFNYKFTPLEILWSFSIFLESVAILPQMFLLQRLGEAETITTHYIFALGAYRTMYLFNWVYRLIFEHKHHFDYIAFIAGLVQTGLYADFFYIYYEKVLHGKKFELPA